MVVSVGVVRGLELVYGFDSGMLVELGDFWIERCDFVESKSVFLVLIVWKKEMIICFFGENKMLNL